jgi:hypothetical protein
VLLCCCYCPTISNSLRPLSSFPVLSPPFFLIFLFFNKAELKPLEGRLASQLLSGASHGGAGLARRTARVLTQLVGITGTDQMRHIIPRCLEAVRGKDDESGQRLLVAHPARLLVRACLISSLLLLLDLSPRAAVLFLGELTGKLGRSLSPYITDMIPSLYKCTKSTNDAVREEVTLAYISLATQFASSNISLKEFNKVKKIG